MRLSDMLIIGFILLCALTGIGLRLSKETLVAFKCERVIDGDTIVARAAGDDGQNSKDYRIRLIGIDAPESGYQSGQAAKRVLKDMLEGKWALCKLQGIDMYKRSLCDVVMNGESVNLKMITSGMSIPYVYSHFPSYFEKQVYLINYSKALKDKKGLWREFILTNPYRQRKLMRS